MGHLYPFLSGATLSKWGANMTRLIALRWLGWRMILTAWNSTEYYNFLSLYIKHKHTKFKYSSLKYIQLKIKPLTLKNSIRALRNKQRLRFARSQTPYLTTFQLCNLCSFLVLRLGRDWWWGITTQWCSVAHFSIFWSVSQRPTPRDPIYASQHDR